MATQIPSQGDLLELYKNEVQSRTPELTDFEIGSINDAVGGGFSVGGEELAKLIVEKFNKTYIETAHGPEVTGGPDDLQLLATDHFGESFARPEASKATTTVDFSRPTTTAGAVSILAGTIVKTDKDANGNELRFTVLADVTMTGLSISASVEAVEAGSDSNVNSGTIINIETSLTDDTVVVTNPLGATGGDEEATDSEYREFIRLKVETIRGATKAAIEAAAVNVPGVEIATAIENLIAVIEWDIGGSSTVGTYFRIPDVKLYIADANGTASQALIDLVDAAVLLVRACGVRIEIIGATPLSLDWRASFTLNPGGPNFATLSSDPSQVEESMAQYIRDFPIGSDFDKGLANLAMLAIWGPSGTNDLVTFTTNEPVGGVVAAPTEKLIPGTVEIV